LQIKIYSFKIAEGSNNYIKASEFSSNGVSVQFGITRYVANHYKTINEKPS
jgi:hypothetical protein